MNVIERLELTTDTDQQDKLRRKLEEYAARLTLHHAPRVDLGTFYKHLLLKELLEKGVVDVFAIRSVEENEGMFHAHSFDQAVQIIWAYNSNDTALLRGGTGLR